jgi:hypothetical protein
MKGDDASITITEDSHPELDCILVLKTDLMMSDGVVFASEEMDYLTDKYRDKPFTIITGKYRVKVTRID